MFNTLNMKFYSTCIYFVGF